MKIIRKTGLSVHGGLIWDGKQETRDTNESNYTQLKTVRADNHEAGS